MLKKGDVNYLPSSFRLLSEADIDLDPSEKVSTERRCGLMLKFMAPKPYSD